MKIVLILLGVIVIAALALCGYVYWLIKNDKHR